VGVGGGGGWGEGGGGGGSEQNTTNTRGEENTNIQKSVSMHFSRHVYVPIHVCVLITVGSCVSKHLLVFIQYLFKIMFNILNKFCKRQA
jgi:hypothetical protein